MWSDSTEYSFTRFQKLSCWFKQVNHLYSDTHLQKIQKKLLNISYLSTVYQFKSFEVLILRFYFLFSKKLYFSKKKRFYFSVYTVFFIMLVNHVYYVCRVPWLSRGGCVIPSSTRIRNICGNWAPNWSPLEAQQMGSKPLSHLSRPYYFFVLW